MITLLTILLLINTPPNVSITSHVTNQIVQSGEITIKATATDADGKVAKVVFYVNTSQVGTALKAPYTTTITLTPGKYLIKAKAYDNLGATRTTSVTIDVRDLQGDFANAVQAITARMNALEAELKKQSDSQAVIIKNLKIKDTLSCKGCKWNKLSENHYELEIPK